MLEKSLTVHISVLTVPGLAVHISALYGPWRKLYPAFVFYLNTVSTIPHSPRVAKKANGSLVSVPAQYMGKHSQAICYYH